MEADLIAYLIAAGLLTVTPGVDTALVLRTATVEGVRPALAAGSGICLGVLGWGAVTALGLTVVLAASKTAYLVLQVAGAAYLIWLGAGMLWRAWRPAPRAEDGTEDPRPGLAPGWFLRGLLTNLLNPKVGVFYLSFLPQFIPAGADTLTWSLILAAIHAAMGIGWFAVLVTATQPLSRWLRRPAVVRLLDGTTGSVLVAFGVGLALQKRSL